MKLFPLLLITLLFFASCGSAVDGIKLSHDLKEKYQCEKVTTSITDNKSIKITLTNCPCCKAPGNEQQMVSKEINSMLEGYYGKDKMKISAIVFESTINFE